MSSFDLAQRYAYKAGALNQALLDERRRTERLLAAIERYLNDDRFTIALALLTEAVRDIATELLEAGTVPELVAAIERSAELWAIENAVTS